MKKLLLLTTMLFATLFVGCSESGLTLLMPEYNITITITSLNTDVKMGEKGSFTITSDMAVVNDLVVEVSSDKPEIATVPATVTIAKGSKTVNGEFSAVSVGKATLTISCKNEGIVINNPSTEVSVSKDGGNQEKPEVEVPATGTFLERMKGAKIGGNLVIDNIQKVANGLPGLFKDGRYMIKFKQPLDHSNKSSETFTQRVIVSIVANDKPVVFVTQGYGFGDGWDFESSSYTEELVDLLDCNQVVVEHRFFEESTPSPRNWKYHTIENEVNDLHRINLVLREVFKGQKFISTGRSKGGQTAIYYEAYFPKDIDIAVPYVAPICYQLNDPRHAAFLKTVGDATRRNKIKALQQEMFDRRDELVPMFKNLYNASDFTVDMDIIFDLCVLEYSFMCWQYNPYAGIPSTSISNKELLNELNKCGASYYSPDRDPSFIMNARHDIGCYGYDVTQFTNTVITQAQADRWIEDIATPADGHDIQFDPTAGQKVKAFLQGNTTEKMIFIYGEYDAWSAAAVDKAFFSGKSNMFRYDAPGGDHSTFIGSFKSSTKTEIINKIKGWLKE
ncbi:MAG: S28 family serine protease [Rikenellaceae bacterium]